MAKKNLKYSVLILFIASSILSCASLGYISGHEYKMVEETEEASTIEAYEKYFEKYPNGHYYQEMKIRQEYLIALDGIIKARQINTIEAYENYIEKYSGYYDNYSYEAESAIESIKRQRDEESFSIVKRKNNIEEYKKFILDHPNSEYKEEAEQKIRYLSELQKQEEERIIAKQLEEEYKSALQENTIEAMEKFLAECSEKEYIEKAQKKLDKLKTMKKLEEHFDTKLHVDWIYYNLSNPYGFIKNDVYAFFMIDMFQWLNEDEILTRSYPFEGEDVFHMNLGSIDRTILGSRLSDIIAIYIGSYEYSSNSGKRIVPSFKLVGIDSGVLR